MATSSSLSPAADELKRKANAAFERKEFFSAVQLYSDAIAAATVVTSSVSSNPVDRARAILFGNRSVAHFALGQYESSAQDALASCQLDSTWPKAHIRRGVALEAMGDHRGACSAFEIALRLEPSNTTTFRQHREALALADKADAAGPIRDSAHLLTVLTNVRETRQRLATLATMWNSTPPPTRFLVFREFLRAVAGDLAVDPEPAVAPTRVALSLSDPRPDLPPDGVHISQFDPAAFTTPLPMAIYADVPVPAAWLRWYSAQVADSQGSRALSLLALWRALWDACTPMERALIIEDMRTFYAPVEMHAGGGPRPGGAKGGAFHPVSRAVSSTAFAPLALSGVTLPPSASTGLGTGSVRADTASGIATAAASASPRAKTKITVAPSGSSTYAPPTLSDRQAPHHDS